MIYLASASPRRAELLSQIGVNFEALAVNVDESQLAGEAGIHYVRRMALSKAEAGWLTLAEDVGDAVLGADTIILNDEKIIGKPTDRTECYSILSQLSGRDHQVLTAVVLIANGKTSDCLSVNQVSFAELPDHEIVEYCKLTEPMDKAGAYAIQGRAAIFIKHLEGSYSSVMGLPLFETAALLRNAGIAV